MLFENCLYVCLPVWGAEGVLEGFSSPLFEQKTGCPVSDNYLSGAPDHSCIPKAFPRFSKECASLLIKCQLQAANKSCGNKLLTCQCSHFSSSMQLLFKSHSYFVFFANKFYLSTPIKSTNMTCSSSSRAKPMLDFLEGGGGEADGEME